MQAPEGSGTRDDRPSHRAPYVARSVYARHVAALLPGLERDDPMRVLLMLVALVATVRAQQTWTIGPGGQSPAIDGAMASASVRAGDFLQWLATAGSQPNFTLTKGVTIRGPSTIYDGSNPTSCQTRFLVPPNQRARLLDVTFQPCFG